MTTTTARTSNHNSVAGFAVLIALAAIGVATVAAFQAPQNHRSPQTSFWSSLFAFTSSSSSSSPPTLPLDVVKYSQVPKNGVFKAEKIPKGLLKDHTTKQGTWGLIRVSRGTLEYTIQEPTRLVQNLVAPATGVIEPQRLHHVKALSSDVEFVVEFYRQPGTGPVDEQREGL